MRLRELLQGLPFSWELAQGSLDQEIRDLAYDSRSVTEGALFFCLSGSNTDGHYFLPQALERGAAAILAEHPVQDVPEEVTVLISPSARRALAYLSAAFFGYPASRLVTIGITGTKGKTTTSCMIQRMLELSGSRVGMIGTLGAFVDGVRKKTKNTTPESYEIQSLLAQMVEAGCRYCVMEVSSQGLKMDRVAGISFDYGIFTNFSPDHIGPGEHADLEEYLHCKSLLFAQCREGIVNQDDPKCPYIIKQATCHVRTYSMEQTADLYAEDPEFVRENGQLGMTFTLKGLEEGTVFVATPGRFSVYNSLAALLTGHCLGIPLSVMQEALSTAHVPGRVELVPVSKEYTVLIDYAHNAASVESLLTTLREYHPNRILCVYGCGGNRSRLRRYDMGELCGKMADLSILTCDNPRDEEVADINADIKIGLAKSGGAYVEILDRREAIHYSMDHAGPGDIVVLLGKGHEDYQEIKGVKYPWSERRAVEEYAQAKKQDFLRKRK